jgi:hypothetical protein
MVVYFGCLVGLLPTGWSQGLRSLPAVIFSIFLCDAGVARKLTMMMVKPLGGRYRTSPPRIVPTANGSINAFSTDPTQLVLDINGYFAP